MILLFISLILKIYKSIMTLMKKMKPKPTQKISTILDKLFTSILNFLIVALISLPFILIAESLIIKKFIVIGIFLLYCLLISFFNKGIYPYMTISGEKWKENYPLKNHVIHSVLYTLSFSTLLFSIFFPFDIFIFNMLLLQLPMLIFKKMTLHAYLAGKMIIVNNK